MADPLRVLYVDDEPDLISIGKLFLEQSEDFTVTTAISAQEGIRLFEQEKFDAIISDYQMPELDGIQFLVEVRSRFGPVPFILFTGRGREEVVIQAINRGADFYLQKGGEPAAQFAELAHKIKQAASRKRAEEALLKNTEELHAANEELTASQQELRANFARLALQEQALQESKRELADIIEFLPDATFVIDRGGVVIAWNRAIEEMTGISKGEMIGQGDHAYTVPFYGEQRPQLLELIDLDDEELQSKYQYVTRKGTTLYAEVFTPALYGGRGAYVWATGSPLFDVNGERIGAIESIRDITERVQADLALQESEKKYRDIFEHSVTGLFKTAPGGRMIDANDALASRYGYSSATELLQAAINVGELYDSQEDREEVLHILAEKGIVENYETLHRKRDGTTFWVSITARTIRDADGTVLFYEGTNIDISRRKAAEEALLKNTEELHAANEQLTAVEEELKGQFNLLAESEGRVRQKLESLLAPFGDIGTLDLGDIIDPQVLQRLMDDFTRLSGMGMAILDTKGNVLVATGWQEICTKFHRVNPVTAGFCTESDLHLAKNMKQGEYVAYHCRNHLWDVVTPLYIGTKHMGNIFTGQFFYDDDIVDELVFIRQAEEHGFDRDTYLAALHRVPKFSRQKISELMDYLVKLTAFISLISYRNLELARTVTERNILLTSLQNSEGKFRTLVENIPQKIFLKDLDSRYVMVNEIFARDLGISPEEMVGKSDADLFPDELATRYRENDIRVLKTGKTGEFEERYLADGKETWVHTVKTVVKEDDGKVVGLLGVLWDVTGRKRAEEALRESEQKFRVIANHTVNWESWFGADGKYIWVSPSVTQFTGYSDAEILALPDFISTVIAKEDQILFTERFREAISGTRGENFEFRYLHRNGTKHWLNVSWQPIVDMNGNSIGTRASGHDITDRKRAEDALKESEEKYRSLFNQSTVGIVLHDLKGRILDVNEMACTQSGYSREELLSITVFDGHPGLSTTFPPKAEILRIWNQWAPGQRFVIEAEHQRKDGTIYPVEISMGVVQYGNSNAILALVKDITERKLAEDALRLADKKLNLLSSITRHDINNQLTVQMGYLSILEKQLPDVTLNEYFQNVSIAAKRIAGMIQFTKEYEKIGIKAPTWQDWHTLVDNAAKQATLGKVMVKNDVPAGAEVCGDPMVVRVFYNLMDNAVRYGGKITTIRFSAEERSDDQLIVCEDDGVGIAAAEKGKIFERGFGKNTGLGLALSREILDITGITIKETGEPGKGARFEIIVPKGAWRMAGKRG
ncbi:MAG: PAS domain S-box protein [Methanomicrobiales archaeon]|nr:PAS domain S-box protein [Methanomicrobiales archaeon]